MIWRRIEKIKWTGAELRSTMKKLEEVITSAIVGEIGEFKGQIQLECQMSSLN